MIRLAYVFGGALLAGALVLWFYGLRVFSMEIVHPLQRPFPLVAGQQIRTSFVPEITTRHYLEVELDRNLPMKRLRQIIEEYPERPVARPLITFAVEAGGQPVTMKRETCARLGDRISYCLASFEAKAGEAYQVEAQVIRAHHDLRVLNATLGARIHPQRATELYLESFKMRAAAVLAGLIGLVVLALAFGAHRRGRRTEQPHAPAAQP